MSNNSSLQPCMDKKAAWMQLHYRQAYIATLALQNSPAGAPPTRADPSDAPLCHVSGTGQIHPMHTPALLNIRADAPPRPGNSKQAAWRQLNNRRSHNATPALLSDPAGVLPMPSDPWDARLCWRRAHPQRSLRSCALSCRDERSHNSRTPAIAWYGKGEHWHWYIQKRVIAYQGDCSAGFKAASLNLSKLSKSAAP
eukprot:1141087-Pelagomonas_calceolata.AAC.16